MITVAESKEINIAKRESLESPILWFDATSPTLDSTLLVRAIHSGYSGVLVTKEGLAQFESVLSDRMEKIVAIESELEASMLPAGVVLASRDLKLIATLAARGLRTAFRAYVDDAASLHDAIESGKRHEFVIMSFKDPTNIPLELVIASLQFSRTKLVKEIAPHDVDDAIVSVGVMEVGSDGVMFSPSDARTMEQFISRWKADRVQAISLSEGEVVRSVPVGMGYRSCIDLATLFTPTEGMIVGSTSHGGVLCCPEVFHLPYMELRPFRVNAGAVHSYVYNMNNRTDYMTELRAGSPVMVADAAGKVRQAFVGRVKTEVRPLRLIEVKFTEGRTANILLQDDWHVRIFSADVKPMNITELKAGDMILGYAAEPGRHVGIQVAEHIIER